MKFSGKLRNGKVIIKSFGRGSLTCKDRKLQLVYRSCVFKIGLFASPIPKIPHFLDSEAPPAQKLNVRLVSDVIRCSHRTH